MPPVLLGSRALRFAINGLVATAVNYLVMRLLMHLLGEGHAGVSALVASVVGTIASFLGNRFFVFHSHNPFWPDLLHFKVLYLALALTQAVFMGWWVDGQGWDHHIGFVLITAINVGLSYVGNRFFVFR